MRRREPVRRPLNVPREYFSRRGLAGFHRLGRGRARGAAARAARALVPAGRARGTSRSPRATAEGRFRVETLGERERAGDLRDRLPARLPARPAARAPRRRARARDGRTAGSCSHRTARVPALTDETRTLALAGVAGAVGVPGRRHARRRAVRRPRLPAEGQGMSYTLRGRIESRLAALAAGRRGRLRARRRRAPLVAGRGGRR